MMGHTRRIRKGRRLTIYWRDKADLFVSKSTTLDIPFSRAPGQEESEVHNPMQMIDATGVFPGATLRERTRYYQIVLGKLEIRWWPRPWRRRRTQDDAKDRTQDERTWAREQPVERDRQLAGGEED